MADQPSNHTLLQEPLIHFVLLAVLIFVAHWAIAEPEPAPVIAVDEKEVQEYRENFQERHFRPPTPEEIARFRQNRINEEILYREGLNLGLDRRDPVIKARVISKMQLVLAEESSLADPGDEVLARFLQQQAERYRLEARYSFDLVRLPDASESVRAALVRAVFNGADPVKAGLHRERFQERNESSVSAAFGPDFPALLEEAAESGDWQEVELGGQTQLLRTTGYQPAEIPALKEIRRRVLADWQRSERVRQVNRQVTAMADNYTIQP